MNPALIVLVSFGSMAVIVGITMVSCIPVFKAQARRKAEREKLKLRLMEEKELRRLKREEANAQLELQTKQAQANANGKRKKRNGCFLQILRKQTPPKRKTLFKLRGKLKIT